MSYDTHLTYCLTCLFCDGGRESLCTKVKASECEKWGPTSPQECKVNGIDVKLALTRTTDPIRPTRRGPLRWRAVIC